MNERPEDRIDDLVRDAERRAWDETPRDDDTAARDRAAVLARISRGRRSTHRARPDERARPWWRVVAPVAVAAGLVGLFVLRDQVEVHTPTSVALRQPADEAAPVADDAREVAAARGTPAEEGAAALTEGRATAMKRAQDGPLPAPSVPVESMTARARGDADGDTRLTLVDTVSRRVETILETLGPVEEPAPLVPAVRDSLVALLRELRPRLTDDALARRVDLRIAPEE